MIRREGQWQECDWQTALEFVANGLKAVKEKHGAQRIGALASPHSTLEELYLLQKLCGDWAAAMSITACANPISAQMHHLQGAPWLGMPIADFPG